MAFRVAALLCCLLAEIMAQPALAQNAARQSHAARKAEVNEWTVGLAGGLLEGTFIRYAADLANLLNDGDNLRVIPMVTFGAVGNVSDLLNLKGVDVAITQSDVLDHFRNEAKMPDIQNRIRYISPLYLAELHIYARPEIKSVRDLEGKKVAFNTAGSAANLTGTVVLQRLGIKPQQVLINNALALEKMRAGEIAAVVHVVGKPNDLFAKFKPEPGFHFLSVDYDQRFEDYYVPSTLSKEDYPQLIAGDEKIRTLAVPTVLAVYNWPKDSDRYRRVVRFIDAYFAKYQQLRQLPYQPKWRDINIAGTIPGWTRYGEADRALQRLRAESKSGTE